MHHFRKQQRLESQKMIEHLKLQPRGKDNLADKLNYLNRNIIGTSIIEITCKGKRDLNIIF